ncbi:hypothetical protein CJF31_00010849 [Rutstroemia sp. NJR-2017a BVV2]|nr:hypothetical protein CJF31_00010849 [Rutstroemia sp. NJR-2017a BVV2]
MAVGMKFHHFADPKPPRPNFKIRIPSRLCPRGGHFNLIFYVPNSYYDSPEEYRFPVVVNYHGGGFTLGTGTDDARWAATVLENVDAVLVSVEYRLAPEHPFSVGVEDGTDAVIYLAAHAEELRLDPQRMALSGFSAGGNFAFTVPLMLHDLKNDAGKRTLADSQPPPTNSSRPNLPTYNSTQSSNSVLLSPRDALNASSRNQSTTSIAKIPSLEPTSLEISQSVPDLTLCAIVSFYPPTDFSQSREAKRATNPAPEKNLPPMLTRLFDESYMAPIDSIDLRDPYLSPAAASDSFLRDAYPQDIILYTCEYDMLNAEGVAFGERLSSPEVGKTVKGGLINCVPHAFDKKPNPLRFPKEADRCYAEACAELARVFGTGRTSVEERTQLEMSKKVDRFGEGDIMEAGGLSRKARDLIDNTSLAEGRRESGMLDNHAGVEDLKDLREGRFKGGESAVVDEGEEGEGDGKGKGKATDEDGKGKTVQNGYIDREEDERKKYEDLKKLEDEQGDLKDNFKNLKNVQALV